MKHPLTGSLLIPLVILLIQTGLIASQCAAEERDSLLAFDQVMNEVLRINEIPGATLCLVKDGKLIYAKGFGLADEDKKLPAQVDSVYRIASLSKCITAVATVQLVEQGKLKLTDPVFSLLKLKPYLKAGEISDHRLDDITVEHLLRHRAGWDDKAPNAPRWGAITAQKVMGLNRFATTEEVIRVMMREPLNFDPGSRMAYSNFGYLVLGRVIEAASGQSYEDYVTKNVLLPLGMTHTRLAKTAQKDAWPKEVCYYDENRERKPAPFGGEKGTPVTIPYRYNYMERLDSFGGWTSSGIDLARFMRAFDDPEHCEILSAESIHKMWSAWKALPPELTEKDGSQYYGLGWSVKVRGVGQYDTSHTGRLPGTSALLSRHHDGLHWVALMNRPMAQVGEKKFTTKELDRRLSEAAQSVKNWPKEDLFSKFPEK